MFSKTDGVVHWRLSMAPETPRSENIVVQSSHLGLGANPAVLWAIADRLAQAEGEWQPMDRNGWHSVFFLTKGSWTKSCSALSTWPRRGRSDVGARSGSPRRSEDHTPELQSLMRLSYAVFYLKQQKQLIR